MSDYKLFSSMGIDKIEMSCRLKSVNNIGMLIDRPNVKCNCSDKKGRFVTTNGTIQAFSYLNIKDNDVFIDLTCVHAYNVNSVKISFSPTNIYGNNLDCFDIKDLEDYIDDLQCYLKTEYGLHVMFSNMEISYVELAKTFILDQPYYKYEPALKVFFWRLPYIMNQDDHRHTNLRTGVSEFTGCRKGNKEIEWVAYNKKKQLEKNHKSDAWLLKNDLMRIEVRLKTRRKIEQVFGTCRFDQWSDDLIVKVYGQLLEAYLFYSLENYKILMKRIISSALKHQYQRCGKGIRWQAMFVDDLYKQVQEYALPVILDMDIIEGAVNKVINNKNRNRKRTINTIEKILISKGALQEYGRAFEILRKAKGDNY